MENIISTYQITQTSDYKDSPLGFFSNFGSFWSEVQGQVLKLETRQVYREPGNPSYEELENNNYEKAIEILPEARKVDIELYQQLNSRKVDFVRCRPIVFPISKYLKWELECYKFNSAHGEKIYFTDRSSIFDEYVTHDFMVFDRKVAVIHNYDNYGEIQGGWIVLNQKHIDILIMLFSIIKASSINYQVYIENHNNREW